MHVRLGCPDGSSDCVPQSPPPTDEGCGPELDALIDPPPPTTPRPRRARPPRPPLPDRCQPLLGPLLER
jgi:penicillin-insensitive murein endopeptidase